MGTQVGAVVVKVEKDPLKPQDVLLFNGEVSPGQERVCLYVTATGSLCLLFFSG